MLSGRCWRLLVASSAATGVVLAAARYDVWWTALSQLASLAVAVVYLGLALAPGRRAPSLVWLRGALASLMVTVALGFLARPQTEVLAPFSVFEHLLTPTLVVVDFVLVGGGSAAVLRWWHPVTWLAPPALYLAWYVVGDLAVYPALDTGRPAAFTGQVATLGLVTLLGGIALATAHRHRRNRLG